MAKQQVASSVASPARKATGGKPIANTTNLTGLAHALMALGKASQGRSGGGAEMRLLDGTTYDQLAERCLETWLQSQIDPAVPPVVVLVEGQHFRMDSKLKSIKARIQRALAGGSEGDSRKDELHTLKSYEVTVKAIDAVKGFRYIGDDGKMREEDIPNCIYVELNPGIAEKAYQWAEIAGIEIPAVEADEEADEEADA